MGRRIAVDAAVTAADSPQSSSAESSFRELDDVFLQTQTRIWLGEVLKTRLNEDIHVSNLLADGELLFDVSKLVWNMLLEKCAEIRHLKGYQHPLHGRKSSGRYMPYSNVDSFLKICKVLGLNGIDLFSPSDVVEKRDTRKVCICIRALSKKARSKQLNVPDFDVVSHAIAMPTDMVGCIRRSLESSQFSFSSSSSYNSFKDTRYKIQQKSTTSECDRNYDSASDVSDEAESKYYGPETYCCSETKFNNPTTLNLDKEFSSDAFSAVKQQTKKNSVSSPELGKPYVSEFKNGDQKSELAFEFSLHHSRNGNDSNNLSSCHKKSPVNSNNRNSRVNKDIRPYYGDTLELNDVDLALRNDDSCVGDSFFDNIAGRDFISDYLAFSDSVVFGADGSSPFLVDGEDNMCNFFRGIDSISSSNQENRLCQKSLDDVEDVEVSSTTSMTSILGRVLNMDLDEQFDVVDSSTMKVEPTAFLETHSQHRRLFMEEQILEVAEFETLSHSSVTAIKESQHEMRAGNLDCFTDFHSTCHNRRQPCNTRSHMHEKNSISQIHPDKYKFLEEKHPGSSAISSEDISEAHQESTSQNETVVGYSECAIEEHDRQLNTLDGLEENVSDKIKDPRSGHQRPLLKTFVGGTALVGALFLFLHISRRGQRKSEAPSKQLNQTQKFRGSNSSSQKEQSGRPNGTYPAEKLKFGK